MKSIIIDWDNRKFVTDKDIKDILENDLYPYNIIIISSSVKVEQIIQSLKDISSINTDGINKIKIISDYKDKVFVLQDNLEILKTNNDDEFIFVSSHVPTRAKVKTIEGLHIVATGAKLPEIPKAEVQIKKDYTHPTKQRRVHFPLNTAQAFRPTHLNMFKGKISTIEKINPKKPLSTIWFAKEKSLDRVNNVQLEVLAGELLRFLLGEQQPKSRYIIDQENIFVLSKKIDGFNNFQSKEVLDHLYNNNFKGLLPVLFASMVMEEADMNLNNIGIDSKGQIVKIDNDGAFTSITFSIIENTIPSYAELRKNLKLAYTFTANDMAAPHLPTNYDPTSWLPKALFDDKNILTPENKEDLFYLFTKMISTLNIMLSIIDKNIESLQLRETVKEVISSKINSLSLILTNDLDYKDYLTKNYDQVIGSLNKDIQQFNANNKYYFKDMPELDINMAILRTFINEYRIK